MLKQRVITGLVLLVLALWALFQADSLQWQVAIILTSLIAGWEWAQFVQLKQAWLKGLYTFTIGCVIAIGLQLDWQIAVYGLALLQLILVGVYVSLYQRSKGRMNRVNPLLAAMMGLVFIVSFAWSLIDLRESFGVELLLFSMATIWLMDTGAYFSGRKFGRNKLASYVSPGKTWEGVLGGVLLVFGVATLVWLYANHYDWQRTGLLAFVLGSTFIAGLSVYGDLFESLLKRQANIKDSGKILPGHGGVLDRLDSLLLALPLYWVFWSLVA